MWFSSSARAGGHTGTVCVPGYKTPVPCNLSQPCCAPPLPVPIPGPFPAGISPQKEFAALFWLEKHFKSEDSSFSNSTEGSHAPKGLIAMKPRLVLAHTPPPARSVLAALHPGIYSTVNFECVPRTAKAPAGNAGMALAEPEAAGGPGCSKATESTRALC